MVVGGECVYINWGISCDGEEEENDDNSSGVGSHICHTGCTGCANFGSEVLLCVRGRIWGLTTVWGFREGDAAAVDDDSGVALG